MKNKCNSNYVYKTLDFMRGCAAISVITIHNPLLFGSASLRSSFLAVDMFFILSGFIISHSYGNRLLSGMYFYHFIKIRLIRLYPLYIFGLILGLITALISLRFGKEVLSPAEILFSFIAGLFMLPAWPGPNSQYLYPLLMPAWSLFFELFVNIAAALMWRWLLTPVLIALITVSAAILVGSKSLDGGVVWGDFILGFPRVTFSFFGGILLYRMREFFSYQMNPFIIAVIMLSAFAFVPPIEFEFLYHAIVVFFIFPLLVIMGANSEPSHRLFRVFLSAGTISYAVYILHLPLSGIIGGIIVRLVPNPLIYAPATGIMFIFILLIFCWLADRYYDAPIRQLLTRWLIVEKYINKKA